MGPRSAPYDCPVWAQFNPCLVLFTVQPHAAPFKPHAALFKWQPVVREKQGRYQNDQHGELSHMDQDLLYNTAPSGPCSTLIWPHSLFSPMWPHSNPVWPHSPFSPMQESHSEEMTSKCSITRYTKMFSSTSRQNCSSPDHLSTVNSPACQ